MIKIVPHYREHTPIKKKIDIFFGASLMVIESDSDSRDLDSSLGFVRFSIIGDWETWYCMGRVKSAYEPIVAHQARAYPGSCSRK